MPTKTFFDAEEHDACGLIAFIRKRGEASHGNVQRTIEALEKMSHRSGGVRGEGDGCGIMTDIPRKLWARALEADGKKPSHTESKNFFVAHFFIPAHAQHISSELMEKVRGLYEAAGLEILAERSNEVRREALGPIARQNEPEFWQVGGLVQGRSDKSIDRQLFRLQMDIERQTGIHVVSLSRHVVVYKVLGGPSVLSRYYPELNDPDRISTISIGHTRYSTNTLSTFERVQPFQVLGHNGEINTVDKLRREARMLGMQLVEGGSDSQDLDRVIEALITEHDLTLIEAMEIIFPPVAVEMDKLPAEMRDVYHFYRWAFGPLAQGPAGIVSRAGDDCVFCVDALGLRPVWFGETEKEYFFCSEKGVVPFTDLVSDPIPLAPGEKVAVQVLRGHDVHVMRHPDIQKYIVNLFRDKLDMRGSSNPTPFSAQAVRTVRAEADVERLLPVRATAEKLAAFAFASDDLAYVEALANTANEPIGSLGYDGPLAALAPIGQNLSDYYKEAVAVVTNPAMDREREMEHFNTRVTIGPRPDLIPGSARPERSMDLKVPIFLDTKTTLQSLSPELAQKAAADAGTHSLEDLIDTFGKSAIQVVPIVYDVAVSLPDALEHLKATVLDAVTQGAEILILSDGRAFESQQDGGEAHLIPIDPHLAVAVADRALREARIGESGISQRRRCSLVLRSGALRNLHDVILALGIGAEAVVPTLMLDVAANPNRRVLTPEERAQRLTNLLSGLHKGLEKVISTMGTHELQGYGRIFASIGLAPELADLMEMKNFYGSRRAGLTLKRMDELARQRLAFALGQEVYKDREFRIYPKVWKIAEQVARGEAPYSAFADRVRAVEKETPVSLRHLLDFKDHERAGVNSADVDISVGIHDMPLIISSMSFGSQGETAFRSYAEAAYRMNIVCINGEGGEIKDMIGKYRNNRGEQVASGRFGVHIDFLNAANVIEIKIGQGAKPGEGGHLPGKKVSFKVAQARNATPGVDLISPSNNHDIYSIEDLAQIIEELHTANPDAKVSVKVPVVPNIGVIAVGIAKAGANVITVSGYDGGTGAARTHALKYVGMPVEVGVKEAHRALVQAGIRENVELWCDGGQKTGKDAVKMICLGANRVAFGTLAMVAQGCTVCHQCQLDTCHVGIATQIETVEQAMSHGLKRFVPREFETAVKGVRNLFEAIGEEIKQITADLGFTSTQDMVGRCDLLEQVRGCDAVDLTDMTAPVIPVIQPWMENGGGKKLARPLSYLTKLVSAQIMEEADHHAAGHWDGKVLWEDPRVNNQDRAMGTYLSGAIARNEMPANLAGREPDGKLKEATIHINDTVPGNGLGAFNGARVNIVVTGGAQDGVGKGMRGGKIVILKGLNQQGRRVDGSVGKCVGYGAQKGLFIIQGWADARAGIRLSGADMIVGGEITEALNDQVGSLGGRAAIKGFAFEYMTAGRALVLGDPGPWICAGMTGGVVYLKLNEEMGFDRDAIARRIAKGSKVAVQDLDATDHENLRDLLEKYRLELVESNQNHEAKQIAALADNIEGRFVRIRPTSLQVEQSVSTE